MRITISHKKSKAEAMKVVNDSTEEFFKGVPIAGLQLNDQQKNWDGSTMNFGFTGRMGMISVPITGTVLVTDTDITLDVELPGFLSKMLPEEKVRAGIQSKVRGLLT